MLDTTLKTWISDQLFESVPCNVAIIDRDFAIVDHNRNFERLFGPGRGKMCYTAYKKRDSKCEHCVADATFHDGKVRVNDEVGVDRDGRVAHYLVHTVPIYDGDGQIPYLVEMSTDVTEIKRLQREYQVLFEKVPCYITLLNRDLRIVRANEFVHQTFGATSGQHCYEVFKRRGEKCDDCPAEHTFKDGKSHSGEQAGVNKDGEPTDYHVTVASFSKAEPITHVIEMAVDVTRLHQLEQEKLEAERLAAVGQTVAGLAHGIKNILTGLEGGVYIFKSGLDRSDRSRIDQGWGILDRNIEKISALAKNLLSFSKGQIPNVQMVRPADVVRDVVELYKDAASQQNIRLVRETDENMGAFPFDQEALHSCLTNLISNAIDACIMGDNPACRVLVRCRQDNDKIVFEVEDEGCGMDYDIRQKVFTNFFTTKGRDGTGLGLLLTRKIVQEHGGKITLESIPEKGSLFKMVFPISRLPQVTEIEEAKVASS
ncbi:MAG TPA: ATP-binding protein [bacterium]|nr:ATP-binding protein [bacterium]